MKALIISNLTRKFQAGHFSMIDPLMELGYEVHWAANFDEYSGDFSDYKFKIHHIDFDRNPFKLKNVKAYKQLCELIDNENFDVIHCQSPIGGVLGRIVGNKLKVNNIIYTAHGLHFYKGAPLKNFLVYKNVEKFLAKKTDGIIVMNNEDFESVQNIKLKNNKQNKFKIHGIGIDIDVDKIDTNRKKELKQKLPIEVFDDTKLVISMGDLIPRKDYRTSIKGFAEFLNSSADKNYHYLICGEGPEQDNLISLSEELEISDNVHFLGFRNDISDLLQISDVFLFSTIQEGLPRALMEAMNAGLICIVSNIRGNNDLILDEKSGYLFEVNNSSMVSDKLKLSFNYPERKEEFNENNKIILDKYKVENVKNEMLEIYKKVIV